MFDPLLHACAAPRTRRLQAVCAPGVRGKLSAIVLRSLEQTLTAMPRTSFLNLAAIPDDPDGNAFVRRYLYSVLNLGVYSGGVHPGAQSRLL